MFNRIHSSAGLTLTIYFNGRPVNCQEGDTVAAALLASGITSFSKFSADYRGSSLQKAARPYCQMGSCFGCQVSLRARQVQACMTTVSEGMRVSSIEVVDQGQPGSQRPKLPNS